MRWAFEVGLEVAFTKLTKTSLGNVDETLYCRSCESGSSSGQEQVNLHQSLETRDVTAARGSAVSVQP